MAGVVSRLPNGPTNGDDDLPPIELYKAAVEEYRFQAQFNWSRTQYLLAFNAAILAAATGVASRPGRGASLVFLLGIVAAVLSIVAVRTQHDYYRAARERMTRVEDAHGVPADHRVDTTATLGGRRRTISVNSVVYLILAAVAAADVVGALVILSP